MTPLATAVVLFALAMAVIALFAARLHRIASRETATLPHPDPTPIPAPAPTSKPAAFEGALVAGD